MINIPAIDDAVLGDGGTLGLDGQPVNPTSGYAVGVRSYPSLEAAFREANPGQYIGYWRDQADDGKLYVDLVVILDDRDEAIKLGRARDQIAIWDFAGSSEIRVNE